jgi:hypothetical protein
MAQNNKPTLEVGKDEKTQNSPKPELSNVSVDEKTGELKQEVTDPLKPVLPPIEARLKKLEELQELSDKREAIVDHLESLNKFYISPSGQGCNLKLTDSKGNTFGISHPSIIGEMIHMAKSKLQDELTRIEEAFVFNM